MIHIFHGFLGSPEDFSFLNREDVVLHDLYEMTTLPQVSQEDVLIGYSMGARIAMEIAHLNQFKIKKLIIINSHPGLETDEEKVNRRNFELTVLEKLKTMNKDEFLTYWNALPLFTYDAPLERLSEERYKKSAELFDRFALSKQNNFLPEIAENKDKVLWIVGLKDEKYLEIASEKILHHDIEVVSLPGGHRLFQLQPELKELLQNEGIL